MLERLSEIPVSDGRYEGQQHVAETGRGFARQFRRQSIDCHDHRTDAFPSASCAAIRWHIGIDRVTGLGRADCTLDGPFNVATDVTDDPEPRRLSRRPG